MSGGVCPTNTGYNTIQGMKPNGNLKMNEKHCGFQMPLHYPRFKRSDYETMPEWRLDCLLREYGLPLINGDVDEKRKFAMGAFLWPSQN